MGYTNYTGIVPCGYVSVAATSSTAVALSANLPAAVASSATTARPVQQNTPDYCMIVAETAAIRFRDDGLISGLAAVNATSGGFPLATGQVLNYDGAMGSGASFVSQTGTATVHILWYRSK